MIPLVRGRNKVYQRKEIGAPLDVTFIVENNYTYPQDFMGRAL